jgi:hypothetical protein
MSFDSLAADLKSGKITLPEWEAQMRDFVRSELNTAMILAKGGRDYVTPSDWGFVGSQVKKQYEFLDKFASDIAGNPAKWMNGRALEGRMGLYNEVGYTALSDDLGREAEKNGFTEERRVLTAGNNCDGCIEQADLGWQPIGTLDPIGAEECNNHCHCDFEYR